MNWDQFLSPVTSPSSFSAGSPPLLTGAGRKSQVHHQLVNRRKYGALSWKKTAAVKTPAQVDSGGAQVPPPGPHWTQGVLSAVMKFCKFHDFTSKSCDLMKQKIKKDGKIFFSPKNIWDFRTKVRKVILQKLIF